MFRFVALSALLAVAAAGNYGYGNGYGNGASYGSNYGSNYGARNFGGFSGVQRSSGYNGGVVGLAVHSQRAINFVDVASSGMAAQPVDVDVYSQASPINFNFRSRSSPITLNNQHESSPGSYQETSSQDEPHVSVHTVTRPVVQQVREIITPFRKVTQEVQPVQEQINTLISRGQQANFGTVQRSNGFSGVQNVGFSGVRNAGYGADYNNNNNNYNNNGDY